MSVAESKIFVVADGPHTGHAWLADPHLPTTKVQKFFGTNEAGVNGRLLVKHAMH